MKNYLVPVISFFICQSVKAADKDSTVNYNLPDSVKAIQFMAEINVQAANEKKSFSGGIGADYVNLTLNSYKGRKTVVFVCHHLSEIAVTGINVNLNANISKDLVFQYDWKTNTPYKLLISLATDSAANLSLYSGYVWLPEENKWKLLGTCRIKGMWHYFERLGSYYSFSKKAGVVITNDQLWCQRSNGSWRNMKEDKQPAPIINLFGHIDSVQQKQIDKTKIEEAIASGKTDAKDNAEGVYYKMIKEGSGKQVSVNDTVTVFYKGYLFANDSVFDQTKDKPAIFPLKRLIRGWQIGVPLCRVGGKIKLVIPSDLAYSIRTRSAKIPPNSILVFEIEVLDAKPPQ